MTTSLQPPQRTEHSLAAGALLCGIDFSAHGRLASDVAALLARRLSRPLDLVHVTELPGYSALRSDLHAEAERLRQQGVSVDEVLLEGVADEELVKRAQARLPSCIILGALGKRLPERWLLGSVAERTAERAPVPTLVVRDAAPFAAWTHGERPLKVFVAFNLTATSEVALRWVTQLRDIGPCDVVVGYVDWPPEQRTRLGVTRPFPALDNPPEVQDVLERDLQARASELLGPTPFKLRVEANWGRPDVRLAEMAREQGCDLLVVGSHQYRGFERLWHQSVSRGLLQYASMNVAVVPLSTCPPSRLGPVTPVRRVLVATDFSNVGNEAIPHAYSLLGGGGTVRMVHVVEPRKPGGATSRSRHESHLAECVERLRSLTPEESGARGILTEIDVLEHHGVGEGICQAAERFGADVICVGTHGRTGVTKALLGSVAQQVLAHTRRPVFLVRPRGD